MMNQAPSPQNQNLIKKISAGLLLFGLVMTSRTSASSQPLKLKTLTTTPALVAVLDVTRSDVVTSSTIKAGATDVPVLAVNFRAINAPITINSLTFTRISTLSPTADVQSVFTLKNGDGSVLTNYKKPFDPTNPNTLTFNALNLKLNPNQIKTIILKGDIADLSVNTSYNFSVSIKNKEDITALNSSPKTGPVKNPAVIINDGDGVTNLRDPFDGPNNKGEVQITVQPKPKPVTLLINQNDPHISLIVTGNSQNVQALSLNFSNSGDSALTINNLTLTGYVDMNMDNIFQPGQENGYNLNTIVSSVGLYKNTVSEANRLGTLKTPDSSGHVYFDNLNWTIAANNIGLKLLVAVSVNDPVGAAYNKFSFDVSNNNDIQATATEGNAVIVSGAPVNGRQYPVTTVTLINNGRLTIQPSDSVIPSNFIIGGTNNILMDRFKVKASSEDFVIQKLSISLSNPTADRDVASITLRFPTDLNNPTNLNGSATQTNPVGGSNGRYDFAGLDFKVGQERDDVFFEVYLNTNPIQQSSPAVSGDQFGLDFEVDGYPDSSGDRGIAYGSIFKAVGLNSAETITIPSSYLTTTNVNSLNNTITLVKNLPTYSSYVSHDHGCPGLSLEYGPQAGIYCFAVTASSFGPIQFMQVKINLATGNIDTSSNGLASTVNPPTIWRDVDSQISTTVNNYSNNIITFRFTAPEIVEAGQTKYYLVKANVISLNPANPYSYLSATIKQDSTINMGSTGYLYTGNPNIVWSDMSALNHSVNTTDWFTGFKMQTSVVTLK